MTAQILQFYAIYAQYMFPVILIIGNPAIVQTVEKDCYTPPLPKSVYMRVLPKFLVKIFWKNI